MLGILLTHAIARREGKPPFFFSRFNFDRMKEAGNTHYCFACGGGCGFHFEEANGIKMIKGEETYLFGRHKETHNKAVVGNADKYTNVWDWLEKEIPTDFPFIVSIPSIY